ncbi:hypothetical protein EX895_005189 [Sporisorium graminicola]|uniref:Uncharacterized protein n=1 Tax=Sporisorium graminicola TaxID=280036 RepID=A0A4U7KMX1_9BASI|nr:hypothetical protein EX895_005189 [Sporisorium graminicola]TKY85650.1 hypothetical protein EX895_005189 [Sporisorium graminicola]
MPESVMQAGETTQFLWQNVQAGTLVMHLPPQYAEGQEAWKNFVRTDGLNMIHAFFQFMDMAAEQKDATYPVGDRPHKRTLAEMLVKAFAVKRLTMQAPEQPIVAAGSMAARVPPRSRGPMMEFGGPSAWRPPAGFGEARVARVSQSLEAARAEERRAAQRRAEQQRAEQLRQWGKTLGLG